MLSFLLTLILFFAAKSAFNAASNESNFADISSHIIFIASEYGNSWLISDTDMPLSLSLSRISAAVTNDSGISALYDDIPDFWIELSFENLIRWYIIYLTPRLLKGEQFKDMFRSCGTGVTILINRNDSIISHNYISEELTAHTC